MFTILSLLIALNVCIEIQTVNAGELNYNVHLFYYPWYGAPPVSKSYIHWIQHDHKPPQDIASNYYPVLGAYDSCDPKVLDQHMEWINESSVGTIITSWWGQGSYEDHCVEAILDAAHKYQIKVGFHIETYKNRSGDSVVSDVEYINQKYGKHAAYFRDASLGNKDAFYIFYSNLVKDWSAIEPLKTQHVILAQNTDQKTQHFGGFYNYAFGDDHQVVPIWKSMNDFCKARGQVWSPSVGPGYIDRRAKGGSAAILERKSGQTYDDNWTWVFESGIPHWVSITSFNEWHEGSMIEPALETPPIADPPYSTYSGNYNKTGKASEKIFLERTAYWVNEFTKRSKSLTSV